MWTGGLIANGSGFTADFSTLDATADIAVSLNGTNRTIGSMTFGDSNTSTAAGWSVTGNTLTLAGTSPAITIGALGTGKIVTINSTLAGTSGLTKEGAGQLTVSNANNSGLSGNITVNGGLLIFNTTTNYVDAFARSGVVTVNAGAELRVTGGINSINRSATDGAFVLNGGTFDYQGSTHGHMSNITLSNGATWKASGGGGYSGENMQLDGDVTVSNTVGITTASTMSNFSQGLGLNGNRTFTVADVTASTAADLNVSAELEDRDGGANGIIKAGAGTMRFTSAQTYTGTTTVNGGTLLFDSGSTLRSSSGVTVNSGATAEFGATNIFTGGHGTAVNNSVVITVNGGSLVMNTNMDSRFGNVTLQNGATWTSNRSLGSYDALLANTSTGAATVSVTNTAGNTSASTMNGSGGIHLQGPQNFNVTDVTGSSNSDLTVNMTLADPGSVGGTAGGVNKLGAGTLSLTKQATYTGGTTVTAGMLSLDANGGGSGLIRGVVTVKSGATLRLNANDVTGYNTGADRVSIINLEEGGVMDTNTTLNQTLGSAVINMTGAQITGISGSNLDFFAGGSALNTLASSTSSVISGTKINLRQTSVTITVADGGAADDLSVSSLIYGNSLVKAGAGTMTLTNANTYTGSTTVNAGTLKLGAGGSISSSPSITLTPGAILDGTTAGFSVGATQTLVAGRTSSPAADVLGDLTLAGTLSPATNGVIGTLTTTGSLTLGGTLNFDRDGTSNASDTIVINGVLTISPGFTINVNTIGVPTTGTKTHTVVSGFTSMVNPENLPTPPADFVWDTSTPGSLKLVYTLPGENLVWKGSVSGDWDLATANWDNGSGATLFANGDLVTFNDTANATTIYITEDVQPTAVVVNNSSKDLTLDSATYGLVGATSIVKSGTGTLSLLSNNIHTGGTTVSGGTLAFGPYAMGPSGLITLDGGALRWEGSNSLDLSSRLVINANKTVNFDTNGNNVNFASVIGSSTNSSLVKSGAGTLTLNGANTYTGTTTINGGTLALASNGVINYVGGQISINNGSSLQINGSGNRYDFTNTVFTFDAAGGGSIITGTNINWVAQGSGWTFNTNGGAKNTIGGASGLNLNSSGRSVTFNVPRGADATSDLDVSTGVGNTNGTLTKTGNGILSLLAANNYSGGTNVNGGTLRVGDTSATNGGRVTLNGGNITVNSGVTYNIDGGLTFASATNATVSASSGTAALRGFDVNSADIIVNAGITASIDGTVSIATNAYGIRFDTAGDIAVGGAITGTGSAGSILEAGTMIGTDSTAVWKKGTGTLTLSGASTFTAGANPGVTSVQNGTVVLTGGNDRLPANSAIYIGGTGNTSGRLVLNGISQTVSGLQSVGTGSANAVVGGSVTASTLTINNTNNYTFAGAVGGAGANEGNLALVKSGGGTLTLGGTLAYSGNTTVNAGTLAIASASLADTSVVTIASGATLSLTHSSTDTVDQLFVNGVQLSPGVYKPVGVAGTGTELASLTGTGKLQVTSGPAPAGYDSWATVIPDADQRDRGDDPDGDGFTNLQEFLFGTSPVTNTASLTTFEKSGGDLVIRWMERTSGAVYQLKESATLANPWSDSAAPVSNDGAATGDYQPRKAVIAIGTGKDFFRVEGVEN